MSKLALTTAVLILSCNPDVPDVPTSSTAEAIATPPTPYVRLSEEPLVTLAAALPVFAGFYCDGGDLVVAVTKPGFDSIVQQSIDLETVGSCYDSNHPHKPQLTTKIVKYNFASLKNWRDAVVDQFFESVGAVGLGIDYKRNRLVFTVLAEFETSTIAVAGAHGIPIDAYDIEKGEKAALHSCSSNYGGVITGAATNVATSCFHPVPGGTVMIHNGSRSISEALNPSLEFG